HRERGAWEDRYQELIEFKEKYGHCNVPFEYKETPKLGKFVNAMRSHKTAETLSKKRIELLESIGFQWARDAQVFFTDKWEERYLQLLYFKEEHGHCNVPHNYSDNQQLGTWVSNQRRQRKQNKLRPERERLLEEIGFLWSASPEPDEL
ncbi:helicase associated domain-containing protein, partial [Desulfobulbus sp. F1]|nr:helicase associated domain-containing protein [Desulfobulbus sp. F1]